MTWYYAFTTREGYDVPFYERTFGNEAAADKWLDASPADRFVTVGMVPQEFYY